MSVLQQCCSNLGCINRKLSGKIDQSYRTNDYFDCFSPFIFSPSLNVLEALCVWSFMVTKGNLYDLYAVFSNSYWYQQCHKCTVQGFLASPCSLLAPLLLLLLSSLLTRFRRFVFLLFVLATAGEKVLKPQHTLPDRLSKISYLRENVVLIFPSEARGQTRLAINHEKMSECWAFIYQVARNLSQNIY